MSLSVKLIVAYLTLSVPVHWTLAADRKISPHVATAAADHRAMAEAHLNTAKCLESGKEEKACHEQLAKDCKGLGIGKFCGMKHRH
jgi:hypothetical protein